MKLSYHSQASQNVRIQGQELHRRPEAMGGDIVCSSARCSGDGFYPRS